MGNTILIIEDNESMGNAMTERLRSFGFDVMNATNMQDAGSMASSCSPDVVLMDLRFADSGQAVSHLAPWSREVPMVLLNNGEQKTPRHLESCGMLSAPFSGNDLLDSVSDALWLSADAANDPVA